MRAAKVDRSIQTVWPSARLWLDAGWSVRSTEPHGWSVYWMEGGELTFFPGDEGPQEARDVDELIEWMGGDQACVLTPYSEQRLVYLVRDAGSDVLVRAEWARTELMDLSHKLGWEGCRA